MGNKELEKEINIEDIEVVESPLLIPLSRILECIESSKTFFNLYLLSRNTKAFLDQNPGCCRNVRFEILRSVPAKTLTTSKPFVHRLKVFISFRDNFSEEYMSLFSNLEYLELCLCSNLIGEGFSNLPKLRHLKLSRCQQMTDIMFGKVPKHLEGLTVSGCKWITGKGLNENLKSLKEIAFQDNAYLKDESLQSCTKIESLELVNCKNLTDQSILFCSIDNPNLKHLRLHVNEHFTDNVLLSCTNLTILDLERIQNLENPPFTNLTSLRKLRLASIERIGECPFPPSLEEVEIKGCPHIQNNCFHGLNNLRTLILLENQSLSQVVFRDLKNLEILTIIECGESIIGHILKGLRKLREVELRETDIHDEIIRHWKDIEVLVLKKCPRVTGLEILKLKRLKEVEIEECIGVDPSVFKKLEKSETIVIRESVLDIRPSVMDFMGYHYKE